MLYRNDYIVLPESTMSHNIDYRVLHDIDVQTENSSHASAQFLTILTCTSLIDKGNRVESR